MIFDGLAKNLKHPRPELRQFVEEEHAPMGQRDFSGAGPRPAADQAGVRDRVVGGPKGPVVKERGPRGKQIGDRVNPGDVEGLLNRHCRKDRRQRTRQESLAGTWRADHQDIVRSARSDLQGTLDVFLAADLAEVCDRSIGTKIHDRVRRRPDRLDAREMIGQRRQALDRHHFKFVNQGRFGGISGRNQNPAVTFPRRQDRHRQNPGDMAHRAVQG